MERAVIPVRIAPLPNNLVLSQKSPKKRKKADPAAADKQRPPNWVAFLVGRAFYQVSAMPRQQGCQAGVYQAYCPTCSQKLSPCPNEYFLMPSA